MCAHMGILKPAAFTSKNKLINDSWKKTEPLINKIGSEYCFYYYIDSDTNIIEAITRESAAEWENYYMSTDYAKNDSIGKYTLKKEIFNWNLLKDNNKIVKKIMDERKEYGMKSGISIPIINRNGYLKSWVS